MRFTSGRHFSTVRAFVLCCEFPIYTWDICLYPLYPSLKFFVGITSSVDATKLDVFQICIIYSCLVLKNGSGYCYLIQKDELFFHPSIADFKTDTVFTGFNPCYAEFTFLSKKRHHKHISQSSRPCHVGIHLMCANVPGFKPFFQFLFQLFCVVQISHQQHNGLYFVHS